MLFDAETDPDEFFDLGEVAEYRGERTRLEAALNAWAGGHHTG